MGQLLLLTCTPLPHRHVLSDSWELQQVLKTAPTASRAAVNRLSQPQGVAAAGTVCEFAQQKVVQLRKQRAAWKQQRQDNQQYEAAKQEALQGWHRMRQQVC